MKCYEITYLIPAGSTQEDIEIKMAEIEALVKKEEGVLLENKKERIVELGYPIKEQKSAHLAIIRFEIEPQKIKLIKKELEKVSEILRFVILTISKPLPEKAKRILGKGKEVTKKEFFKESPKDKKVELEEIEEKLEQILGE